MNVSPAHSKARPNRTLWLIMLGFAGICIAGGVRHYASKHRVQSTMAPGVVDMAAAQAEAGRLLSAVKADPKNVDAHWKLVDFYKRYGLTEKAQKELQIIHVLAPNDPKAPMTIARDLLANQQYEQAETIYRRIKRRWPKEVEAWQGLASAEYHQGRYFEAMEAGKAAVKLNPQDPNNELVLASATLEYVMQFPNPSGYEHEIMTSRNIFTQLIKIWPDNGEIYFRLARACGSMRDTKSEIEYLNDAMRLLPDRVDIVSNLASTYLDRGDIASARKVLDAGLLKNPNNAQLHGIMGRLWEISGEPNANEKALEQYCTAVSLAPKNASYHSHLGVTSLRLQKLPEARDAFLAVTKLLPTKPFAYQQLAVVYNRLGDTARARLAARLATERVQDEQQLKQIQTLSLQSPKDINLHLILADRYRDLHLPGASRDQYLAVLKQDITNRRAKEGLLKLAEQLNHKSDASSQSPNSQAPGSQIPSSQIPSSQIPGKEQSPGHG